MGKPGQELLAKNLHREADVPEGPCGYQEPEKFQDFLGPQGYQLILVELSKCLIVFKQSQFNDARHVIYLSKHHQHYDGLTSIPALVNCSYYCRPCDQAYHKEDALHHNCAGQNCPACLRRNKTCVTYVAWIKPTVECFHCHCFKIVLRPIK